MKFHALLVRSANKLHYVIIIMFLKRKRSVLSIKDKQAIIKLRLEKEEKGTNLSAEYGGSKWQISDIHKSKEKIMMFADTCTGIHKGL